MHQTQGSICPSCAAGGGLPFYEAGNIPAHSCLLMSSRDEAVRYPCGDLRLLFCPACGFISNDRFDPALEEYSPLYEETQHFSDRFTDFATSLATRWIEDFDLRGKTILEIGCGKGEFLDLLCRLGDNRGIGIDPGCIPERLEKESRSRIRFIRDYYSERYDDIEADVILCRHTLEHIPNPGEFVSMLRRTLDDRPEMLVLFELPDMTRILREQAFWDIYYEHCSYFTAGSLARLFRTCGFDLLELRRDYGDQYLTLAARPAPRPTRPRFALEEDLDTTQQEVDAFRIGQETSVRGWKSRLQKLRREGSRTIAWGSGSKCVSFLTTLGLTREIAYVVDINPHRHGKFLPGSGHPIFGPAQVAVEPPDVVVVMNGIYCDEIRRSLSDHGVKPELLRL